MILKNNQKKLSVTLEQLKEDDSLLYDFISFFFGFNLYPYQFKFLKACLNNKRVAGLWSRQCIDKDSIILLSNGDFKKISDIKIGDNIISYNETYKKFENDKVKDVWKVGIRKRYKIKFRSGNSIICTDNHKIYTKGGWKTIKDGLFNHSYLHKNKLSEICSINNSSIIDNKNLIGKNKAKLLGYLLSDGHASGSISFSNKNNLYHNEVSNIIKKEFKDIIPKRKETLTWLTCNHGTNKQNSLSKWLTEIDAMNYTCERRKLPNILFDCSKNEISCFLNRFWAGDGCIYISKKDDIDLIVSAVSIYQAQQIQYLLLKLGIKSRYNLHMGKKSKKKFYVVHISEKNAIKQFFNTVGIIYGKEKKCKQALDILNKRTQPGYYKIENNILWEKISSIEELKDDIVYDIETEKNHNFIANNLLVHNSGKSQTVAIFCLLIAIFTNKKIMIAAPTDVQAKLIYEKITDLINQNEELKCLVISSIREETKFITGSSIRNITVGPTGTTKRGFTTDILIEEEAQDIKDTIHNSVLMPFLISKKMAGQVIKIGTSKTRNHFYKSCFEDKNFELIKIRWEEAVKAGQYSKESVEEAKLNMTDIEFKAEYCSEFVDDINAYFSIQLIESCMLDYQLLDIF